MNAALVYGYEAVYWSMVSLNLLRKVTLLQQPSTISSTLARIRGTCAFPPSILKCWMA